MPNDLILRRQDLITNPSSRVPVCLVLDCSPSMSGEVELGAAVQQLSPRPIDELNAGVSLFYQDLLIDEGAKYSAEIAIIGFSSIQRNYLDFCSLERARIQPLVIESKHGGTHLGQAVDYGLYILQKRKDEYKDAGVDYFQPLLVIMTDGRPTDSSHLAVSANVQGLIKQQKLQVFAIGIGESADMDVLSMFASDKVPALKLKGLSFKKLFKWLSKSVSTTAQHLPGDIIPVDIEQIKDWGDPL